MIQIQYDYPSILFIKWDYLGQVCGFAARWPDADDPSSSFNVVASSSFAYLFSSFACRATAAATPHLPITTPPLLPTSNSLKLKSS